MAGMSDNPEALHGFPRDDLEAIADALDSGYDKTVNVGNTTGEGDEHVPSTTAVAARFIRAALAQQAATPPASVRERSPWEALFWTVAKELNCLPSSFVDANDHVIRKAREYAAAAARQAATPAPAEPTDEHGELVQASAIATARAALGYSAAFDGKGINWHSPEPWPHRIELAQALGWITDLGAMVLNLADRVAAAPPATPAPAEPPLRRTTGWAAPEDRYVPPVLFNPYTGEPRDVRDVQSDPQGVLIHPPGAAMLAAPPATPAAQPKGPA